VSADEAQVAALADVLLLGPDIEQEGSGEWGLTVAQGYARRVLAAGWRPPENVPPALTPTPPESAGGTHPYVRIVGSVADMDDITVGVGVDHDAVTIGERIFTLGQMEELAQLIVQATWQAAEQAAAMAAEASDG
jgi:hypothetical protein